MEFRRDINGLRAWAVAAVVFYHFGVPGFGGGFVGVDIFFVISGFLMTGIIVGGLSEGRFSIWQFYLARARRILPALIVLCLVLLVAGWFILPSTDYSLLGKHVAASLAFLSNLVFWRESGYFDSSSQEKWLLHTWSLSVEWQFYIILPLVLMALWKLWPRKSILTVLFALGLVTSLALSTLITPWSPVAAFYLLPTRMWELLAGGLVYLLSHRWPTGTWAKRLELLGFSLIVGSITLLDAENMWPGWLALVPVTGAALVLMAAQSSSIWTGGRITQYLGTTSYSIYLWHWPIAVALVYIELKDNPLVIIICMALTLVLAHLSYTLIEKPTRRHLAKVQMGVGIAGLALATSVVAIPGALVEFNGGFQSRLPESIERVAREANNIFARKGECHTKTGTKSPSCIIGGNNLGAIVIGDSHAASIITSVQSALPDESYGVLLWSYSSCPTLFGFYLHPNYPISAGYKCNQFNEWALERAKEIPSHVPLIIMNRTSLYARGPNENLKPGGERPRIYFSTPHNHPDTEYLKEFSEHIIEAACEFSKSRDTYLVRPIPEMGVDVPKKMTRALLRGQQVDVYIDLDEYMKRNKFVWDAQDEASRRCGVKILNPIPYLCHDGKCHGSKDGRPLYYDDDHLSEYGNKLLVPMFKQVFAQSHGQHQTARKDQE